MDTEIQLLLNVSGPTGTGHDDEVGRLEYASGMTMDPVDESPFDH
jgi:hypothetical protein